MTRESSALARLRRESELRGEVAPGLEVQACEVWRRMIDRIGPHVARSMGVGTELAEAYANVYKRKQGPHLRLLLATVAALEVKRSEDQRRDVLAPLDWLEQLLGRHAIDLRPVAAAGAQASRAHRLAMTMHEVTEALVAAADEPRRMSAAQRVSAAQEINESIAWLQALAAELAVEAQDSTPGGGKVVTLPGAGPQRLEPR